VIGGIYSWLVSDAHWVTRPITGGLWYALDFTVFLGYFVIIGRIVWAGLKKLYALLTEHIFPHFAEKLGNWLSARCQKIWGEKNETEKLPALLRQAAEEGAQAGLVAGQQALLEAAYQQAFAEAQQKICAVYHADNKQSTEAAASALPAVQA